MSNKNIHLSHSKTNLSIHLILCVKYRKKALVEFGEEIKEMCLEVSEGKKFTIETMEIDEDHIHFLINFLPCISVGYIVKSIKAYTTVMLWKKHHEKLQKSFWKRRVLWSGGYFACSVGNASRKTIERYINEQG